MTILMRSTSRRALLAAAAVCAGTSAWKSALAAPTGQGRSLLVYFSRTGTTKELAGMIAGLMSVDVLELTLREPYAQNYSDMTDIAREERASGARREIATVIPDLAPYETIVVGSPYWWGGLSIPMRTFLMDHPLAGKRVVPFVVSASSGPQGAWDDIRSLCPQARITAGFHCVQSQASASQPSIRHWLQVLGLAGK